MWRTDPERALLRCAVIVVVLSRDDFAVRVNVAEDNVLEQDLPSRTRAQTQQCG